MASSASNIAWPRKSARLYFTEHYDGGSAISQLDPATGQIERLWQGDESINPPFDDSGHLHDGRWQVDRGDPPLLAEAAGGLGRPHRRLETGDAAKTACASRLWGEAKSLHWTSDGFRVQGWLLYPSRSTPAANIRWWWRCMAGRRRR